MKKNNKIEQMTDQEWADAAAWLSGEETPNDEAARFLISEDGEIMKKWNDLKTRILIILMSTKHGITSITG